MTIQVCVGRLPLAIPSPAIWSAGQAWYAVIPCEWSTAATPLKLIGFSAEDFYTLSRNLNLSLAGLLPVIRQLN